jgi:hypothetical protein
MSQRMITIEVAPETAELLRAKATARHLSLDEYLHALVTNEEAAGETKPALSPQERARRWDEWTTRHAVRTPTPVDDSRESIYTREDSAL